MIKRKSLSQNLAIAILSILLFISIVFGVTFSYYNSKSNLVKGAFSSANISIKLFGQSTFGQSSEFSISAPLGEKYIVPGNKLNNVELNLLNNCTQSTYIVVVCSLSAYKNNKEKEDITHLLNNIPVLSFSEDAINTDIWKPILYQCSNPASTFTCLVGINPFASRSTEIGNTINVLPSNSIEIPKEWDNVLQNCHVTISIVAYAIQSSDLPTEYLAPILAATENNDIEAKAQAIANATLQICQVDKVSI